MMEVSDMVERVARAIYMAEAKSARYPQQSIDMWEEYPASVREKWAVTARAAIEALPLREWLAEWEAVDGQVEQEFGLPSDPPMKPDAPLNQLRALVATLNTPPPAATEG